MIRKLTYGSIVSIQDSSANIPYRVQSGPTAGMAPLVLVVCFARGCGKSFNFNHNFALDQEVAYNLRVPITIEIFRGKAQV